MNVILILLIVLLSCAICALAGFWFFRSPQDRNKDVRSPQTVRRPIRNDAWDRAVEAARNRNW